MHLLLDSCQELVDLNLDSLHLFAQAIAPEGHWVLSPSHEGKREVSFFPGLIEQGD